MAAVRSELLEADAVFVGTMGDLVDTGDSVGVRVVINHVWKGKPDKEIVLAFGLRGGRNSCWYTPQSGQHLFFAKRDSSGWWVAYSCGSTGAIEQRAEVSRFLKELCQDTALCPKQAPGAQVDRLPDRGLQSPAATRDPFVLSCDDFPATLTEADIRFRYGDSNVRSATVPDYWGAEGDTTNGVAIFAARSDQRLEVAWFAKGNTRQLWLVRTSASVSQWRTSTGITVGMELPALEALNGRPFLISGFEGDDPSTVQSWAGGRLTSQDSGGCRVVVSLTPSAGKGNERWLEDLLNRQLGGDGPILSNDAAVRALNPKVTRLTIRR